MRGMNKIQKVILWIAVLLLIAMTLYPPWTAVSNPPDYSVTQSIGYGIFLRPPHTPLGYESYVVINYGRLFLQWAGLSVVAGIFLWLFRTK